MRGDHAVDRAGVLERRHHVVGDGPFARRGAHDLGGVPGEEPRCSEPGDIGAGRGQERVEEQGRNGCAGSDERGGVLGHVAPDAALGVVGALQGLDVEDESVPDA